jgi:hypothetical protein
MMSPEPSRDATRRVAPSRSGSPEAQAASTGWALSASASLAIPISITVLPRRALSSDGLPRR